MTLTSCDNFLSMLKKSGLLSPEQFQQAAQEAESAESVDAKDIDAKDVARRIMKQGLLTRWQANMLLAGKHTLRVGKYTLLNQIGRSSISHVHLAEHQQMNRRVALKTLSQRHTRNPESVKKFLAEARTVAALDHRNIIHVYDVDSAGDRYFLVMEHVEGRDLQSLVEKKGPLRAESVAVFLRQVADGLAYAHQQQIVHCDLKPSNLLLDTSKTIKILNLGLAGLADVDESDQQHYTAPEQALDSRCCDGRSDIYALGCIGYFLLTGHAPSADGPDMPPALADICNNMMAESPDERYATAEAVSEALGDWLSNYSALRKAKKAKSAALRRAVRMAEPIDDSDATTGESPSADADDPAGDDAAAPSVVASFMGRARQWVADTPRHWLIGGGVAVVMLVVAAIAAVAIFSGSDARDDSTRGDTAAADEESSQRSADDAVGDASLTEDEPFRSQFDQSDDTGSDDTEADEGAAATPQPKPTVPPAAVSQGPPNSETPDNNPPNNDSPPPTAPAESNPPASDPPASNPPTSDPSPAAPAEPATAPPADPFVDLPETITLPVVGAPPSSLGPLGVGEGGVLDVELMGGENAIRGRQTVTIGPGDSPLHWNVYLNRSTRIDGDRAAIATLAAVDRKLMFAWTDDAAMDRFANHLCNCVLVLRSGAASHQFALRQSVEIDSLTLLFDKTVRSDLKLDWLPNPQSIQIEVMAPEDQFPEHEFQPKSSLLADEDTIRLVLGDGLLSFKIDTTAKRNLQITATAYVKTPFDQKPVRFDLKKIQQQVARQRGEQTRMELQLQQFIRENDKQKNNPQFKALLAEAEQQLIAKQDVTGRFAQLQNLYTSLNETGQLHFRVVYDAGGQLLELAHTNGAMAGQSASTTAANP